MKPLQRKLKEFIWELQQYDPEALVYKVDKVGGAIYTHPRVINHIGKGKRMDVVEDMRKKLNDETIDNVVLI